MLGGCRPRSDHPARGAAHVRLAPVRRYFAQFTEQFDEFRFEFEDVLDAGGDRVVLLFYLHGRGKDSGAVFEERPAWVQTIRDSKAVRIEAYLDRREALKAVGLSERLA